jgi:hypothetical protein
MTVDQHQGNNLPANTGDFANTGLEDFGVTDAVIPRISIVHDSGIWKDNLSGQTYEKLRMIVLGLVKQRVLFHHIVDEGDVPMCKSPDHNTGYPNPEAPAKKSFPWDKAGFDPADYPVNADGQTPLPCDGCALKDWGSNPNGSTPYCAEQWTLPIYFDSTGNNDWSPAILTLQKSSIKPIRSYLTSFARGNKPAFTAICEATLKVNSRGTVDYSVPSFVQAGESDRDMWMEYSENFVQMRGYLTAPPRSEDADGAPAATPQSNVNTAPPAQPTAAQEPQPTAPPAQAAPPQTAPPAQAAPAQTAPPQTAPPAQTAPAQAQAAPAQDDDDLPF